MPNTIYVGNLSYKMNEIELKDAFSDFGDIEDVKIIQDRISRRSRGFGFVTFTGGDAVQKALKMNGKEVNGRNIFVSIAREKPNDTRPKHEEHSHDENPRKSM